MFRERGVEIKTPEQIRLMRKAGLVVGETLDLPLGERLAGTLAATAVSAWHGAQVYRVHEVLETRQVVDMVSSIAGRRPPRRAVRGLA